MPYADYTYYCSEYRGTLPEADFDRLSRRASAYLDNITLGRIQGEWFTDSRVKDACCATAEEIGRQEQGGEVTGETVGKWSRSYATSGESAAARLYDTAVWYLAVTGLLYRGMR